MMRLGEGRSLKRNSALQKEFVILLQLYHCCHIEFNLMRLMSLLFLHIVSFGIADCLPVVFLLLLMMCVCGCMIITELYSRTDEYNI